MSTNNPSAMPDLTERNSLLDLMKSRMPESHQRAIEILERVNDVYVECGRDRVIRKVFDDYLDFTFSNQRYGRSGKGQAFYVTGESGAGKTDAVEHLLNTHPVMQPVPTAFGSVLPYVSITLDGPATLANLGNQILEKSGYTARRKINESSVWPMLPAELARRSVMLVHIDETQHLLAHKHEREKLVRCLKGLMNNREWPLRVLLSGMPETNEMLMQDEQAERRNFSVHLPSVALPEERVLVERIISKLCEAADLSCRELISSDMPERIAHAANYQYGRIAEVVIVSIQAAVLRSSSALEMRDLADAYIKRSHARGYDDMNPFLSDYWNTLKPGYFITKGAQAA